MLIRSLWDEEKHIGDLFNVVHQSTKYSWIKPKWNATLALAPMLKHFETRNWPKCCVHLNMVNVVFNGLHSYHFMLLMRTNPQGRTLCSKTLAKLMLNSFWGKLNIIRKVWCLASFCVGLSSRELFVKLKMNYVICANLIIVFVLVIDIFWLGAPDQPASS